MGSGQPPATVKPSTAKGASPANVTVVSHRELGMTLSLLGMISPRSQLFVKAHLRAKADGAA